MVSFHVGFDASPLRGQELFGGAYYTYTGLDVNTKCLRSFPMVGLGSGNFGLVDKVWSFLWFVWLTHRPDEARMQMWLDSTVSVLTDWGW